MTLICTDCRPCRSPRGRRGAAEIEFVLVIIVLLIPLLLLIGAASNIGRNVLNHSFAAENNAYAQVIGGGNIEPILESTPDGVISRFAYDNPGDNPANATTVLYPASNGDAGNREDSQTQETAQGNTRTFNYSTPGVFLDPTWHLTAYPQTNYSDSDHALVAGLLSPYSLLAPDVAKSLGIQPPGPP